MRLGSIFRLSVLCAALVTGITARPFDRQEKLKYDQLQEVMELIDSFRDEQVEPLEDQDVVQYEVDPLMTVWNSGSKSRLAKLMLKPEEDLDDLHHPSVADLKRQDGNQYAFSPDDYQKEVEKIFNMKNYGEPEEDVDDVAHPSHDQAMDMMVERLTDVLLLMSEKELSVNLQPQEDMDDMFHDNNPQAVPYLRLGEAAVPVDVPSQEHYDYSQPEVDLDHLFHK